MYNDIIGFLKGRKMGVRVIDRLRRGDGGLELITVRIFPVLNPCHVSMVSHNFDT